MQRTGGTCIWQLSFRSSPAGDFTEMQLSLAAVNSITRRSFAILEKEIALFDMNGSL